MDENKSISDRRLPDLTIDPIKLLMMTAFLLEFNDLATLARALSVALSLSQTESSDDNHISSVSDYAIVLESLGIKYQDDIKGQLSFELDMQVHRAYTRIFGVDHE